MKEIFILTEVNPNEYIHGVNNVWVFYTKADAEEKMAVLKKEAELAGNDDNVFYNIFRRKVY